jgi:hypothetical protein
MPTISFAIWMLEQEARALLTRLDRVKPFALHETMLPAANLMPLAQAAIERYLMRGRRELKEMVEQYIARLREPGGLSSTPDQSQRAFSLLRLRFNAVLTQFDIFNDALSQRSENETGIWLSGLDVVAADALALQGDYYQAPPVICYLDRGAGAAIRRARTRLPGGGESPVAIVRVPRERMVGSGIASSLVHEVGHQASALLDLVNSVRSGLRGLQRSRKSSVWSFWERWISEILADFWSVARVGIASTHGLMGVVSLPRAFIFRTNPDDPHPVPWIRVKLSCAMGQALYPCPRWEKLAQLWEAYYPLTGLDLERRSLLAELEASMPEFVEYLINHRPRALRGAALTEAMETDERQPARLSEYFRSWRRSPERMLTASPSIVFAVIGQARVDGMISPEEESNTLARLLTHWALRSTLNSAAICAASTGSHVAALAM